jgi:hypothetical protein
MTLPFPLSWQCSHDRIGMPVASTATRRRSASFLTKGKIEIKIRSDFDRLSMYNRQE